jgi:hypothetical protein
MIRGERPRRRHADTERHELAPPDHSITSSARASSDGGTSSPSARVFVTGGGLTSMGLIASISFGLKLAVNDRRKEHGRQAHGR